MDPSNTTLKKYSKTGKRQFPTNKKVYGKE
jgi:hypothetical protein